MKNKTTEHNKWLQSIVEKIAYQQTAEDQADDCYNKMGILNDAMEQYANQFKEKLKGRQNAIIFAAEMVHKALNPTSKMDVPNSIYLEMEKQYDKLNQDNED